MREQPVFRVAGQSVTLTQSSLDHASTRRFELTEPLRIENGRWVPRYSMPNRGYWLPWEITTVNISTRHAEISDYREDTSPVVVVQGIGWGINKTGKRGQRYAYTFRPGTDDLPKMPELLVALRDLVIAELCERPAYAWPAPSEWRPGR